SLRAVKYMHTNKLVCVYVCVCVCVCMCLCVCCESVEHVDCSLSVKDSQRKWILIIYHIMFSLTLSLSLSVCLSWCLHLCEDCSHMSSRKALLVWYALYGC